MNERTLRFTKMHGAGNDFVLLDALLQTVPETPGVLRTLADRHYGVGCDQILVVDRDPATGEFAYRIYNPDGSAAEQCGNGARCIVAYLQRRHGAGEVLRLHSPAGPVTGRRIDADRIEVELGTPSFAAPSIPPRDRARAPRYRAEFERASIEGVVLSLGNPHLVLPVADVAAVPLADWGAALNRSVDFPDGVNLGVVECLDRRQVRLRVYERGAGETLACGSGACAAVIALRTLDRVEPDVRVHLPGGVLEVRWEGGPVRLAGPVAFVFEGAYGW
jgi:diaminopimelate epimerase